MLPTFLAARWCGTLDAIESVVARVEAIGLAAAVEDVHPAEAEEAIGLEGALRSVRRRVAAIRATLLALVTLMPERFLGVEPTVTSLRTHLGTGRVLVALREIGERHLAALPVPLGLGHRSRG